MGYGVDACDLDKVAINYFTGPPVLPPLSNLFKRVLGVPFHKVSEYGNDPRFLRGIIPSANVVSTANELSRFYQLLLDGGTLDGVTIFDPRTVRRASSEQSYLEFDLTLGVPLRYGMGFVLGGKWFSFYGLDTSRAFGHMGFTNIVAWADPERQVAVALLTSGKPFVYPEIVWFFDIMRRIGLACPKEEPRAAAGRIDGVRRESRR
jgi:CubicO group peptidase (beta-lactamase class C family)